MTFMDYVAKLGISRDRIIGQIPPEHIQLVPFVPPHQVDGFDFVYWDPMITHVAVYKSHQLGLISKDLPLPEWWVCKNSPGDPPGYTVYAYSAHVPEIDLVLELPDDEDVVKEFLKPPA